MRATTLAGWMVCAALAACGDDAERSGTNADASAVSAQRGAFPANEQLCTLTPGESAESDVRAVFGEPDRVTRDKDKTLRYAFSDEGAWSFYFDADGVWTGYTAHSGSDTLAIPECWKPDGGYRGRPDGGLWQRPDGGWR